jgi:NADPH-dependent curcumin reductase CurA
MVDPSIFELQETPVPALEDRQILGQTLYLSFDPTQRAWMAGDTYLPAVPLGETMRALGIAQVIDSRHPKFKAGQLVYYPCGWQEYVLIDPDERSQMRVTKLPGHLDPPLVLALSLTGLTAYFGLLEIGKPERGETVLVSGAAGATGSVAGQIARIKGCRVIGIAGGTEKCRWLTEEARFDGAIDYKQGDAGGRLTELCPEGVDVYFDNVGGEILDEVLTQLAMNARVVLCGAISQYNLADGHYGIKNTPLMIIKRVSAQGFIVMDYLDRALEGLLCLNKWVEDGEIVQEIDMQEGFEQIPSTLTRLFTGQNLGKQLLKVADPPLAIRSNAVERAVFRLLTRYMAWRKG